MKTVRILAAVLLLLTGVLHVIQLLLAKVNPATIITVIFGIIYLALGFLVYRGNRTVNWFAAILPLVGLIFAGIGMLSKPTLLGALFMVIDIVISAFCFYLIFHTAKRTKAQ